MTTIQVQDTQGIYHSVQVASVYKVMKTSLGEDVPFERVVFFDVETAQEFAREQSAICPSPTRFVVLGYGNEYQGTWEVGKRQASFWIV